MELDWEHSFAWKPVFPMKVNQLNLEFLNQKHYRGYSELLKQIGRWVYELIKY